MIRSILAVAAGYLTILGLGSFVRFIVYAYKGGELALTGISSFSSTSWSVLFIGLSVVWGLLGGLITISITGKNGYIEILGLTLMLAAGGLVNYGMLLEAEPLWYLISAPALRISGVLAAYYLLQESKEPQAVRSLKDV